MAPTDRKTTTATLAANGTELPGYTPAEVAAHNTVGSGWMIIEEYVYDVTAWIPRHPGGKVIVGVLGGDASETFHMVHRNALALNKLAEYRIGRVINPNDRTKFNEDFRALRKQLRAEGFYNYSMPLLSFFFGHIVFFYALAWYLYNYEPFAGAKWLALLSFSYGFGQAGWLHHDFGHYSVFKSYNWNKAGHHLVLGFGMGSSSNYWRSAHWKHHLYTNVEGWDHDIETMPLFAWTEKQLARGKFPKWVQRWQCVYWYFLGPSTSFVYITYLGIRYCWQRKLWLDMSIIGAHWLCYWWGLGCPSLWTTLYTHTMVLICTGTYLGNMFSLNHFPMEIYENGTYDKTDTIVHQVLTTRNVEPAVDSALAKTFWSYISGHLNFQTEHHMFPLIPRHRLPDVSVRVRALCKAHGVPHQTVCVSQAFADVARSLATAQKTKGVTPPKGHKTHLN